MPEIPTLKTWTTIAAILISLTAGCDEQVAEVAREAADRQAQQNTAMADLNKEVASGTRSLVEADAKARTEIVGVHRDLQAERTQLDSGWNALEQERQQMAGQRRTESILVPAIQLAGGLVLVVVLLGFCWRALNRARSDAASEVELSELLIEELTAEKPLLLSSDEKQRAFPSARDQHAANE